MTRARSALGRAPGAAALAVASALLACGSGEREKAPAGAAPTAAAPGAPPATPADLPRGLALALAQFVEREGKSVPGPARAEFLYREGGAWKISAIEDPESNVFHKVMLYEGPAGPRILTLGGTAAAVKAWALEGGKLQPTTLWQKDFGGKFSRMRDAEVADVMGDGSAAIAVATHDQGVVALLEPPKSGAGAFTALELDREPNTFVHEIEVGDLDGDGILEIYATPSEPNRLDGSPQAGKVVRYVPRKHEGRVVVADLGDRHAKEILVADIDGDGRQELVVSVEGTTGPDGKELVLPVELRVYHADTPATGGKRIATIPDRLCRFLTLGDIDGDGRKELVTAAFSSGVWLLRPGPTPESEWTRELVDADSAGFEHAAILTDLDGDGRDELYVASDKHMEVRRYVWDGHRLARETIYHRPDARPIFTWNLMPVPVELIPR